MSIRREFEKIIERFEDLKINEMEEAIESAKNDMRDLLDTIEDEFIDIKKELSDLRGDDDCIESAYETADRMASELY